MLKAALIHSLCMMLVWLITGYFLVYIVTEFESKPEQFFIWSIGFYVTMFATVINFFGALTGLIIDKTITSKVSDVVISGTLAGIGGVLLYQLLPQNDFLLFFSWLFCSCLSILIVSLYNRYRPSKLDYTA